MKKYLIVLLVLLMLETLLIGASNTVVYARAGGGSSGGGGGGSSGSTSSHTYTGSSGQRENLIVTILNYLVFTIIAGFSAIVFRVKIMKAKIHSKQLMRILDNKDEAWKYKNVQKQVEKAYFVIQNAWTEQQMSKAKAYMDQDLYDNFQSKIEWMQIRKEKNVLKKISLLDAIPISINDEEDDSKDYIWYYIKGSMIDYTINIETKEIVEGQNTKTSFVEYWKFIRKDNCKWVLCEILQEDEKDKIVFN